MPKPYKWDEIRDFLIKELKKTKYIMTFGTIGSCNVEHDIDVIVTKKPSSKSSDFYKEVHAIYDSLNKHLQRKYKAKAVRFHNLTDENFLKAFKIIKDKDLKLHTMVYKSLPQMEIDWAGSQGAEVKKILYNDYKCLLGKKEDLFSEDFLRKSKYAANYNFIYHADRINSTLPNKNLVEFMNGMFDYILRKLLKVEAKKARNVSEVRSIFYYVLDKLDELEMQKTK